MESFQWSFAAVALALLGSGNTIRADSSTLTWFGPSDPTPEEAAIAIKEARNVTTINELPLCESNNIFEFRLGNDDNAVVVVDTVMVDGCRLECQGSRIQSTVEFKPVITVRNGGIVQDCIVALVPTTTDTTSQVEISFNIGGDNNNNDDYEGWSGATGFLCDSGDCTLTNVSCEVSQEGRDEWRYFTECFAVETGSTETTSGAGAVKIQDSRVVDEFSEFGVKIDNFQDDNDNSTAGDVTLDTYPTSVSLENVEIRFQEDDAIWIGDGGRSLRIANCTLAENGRSGIRLSGGYAVEYLGVFGGFIQNNGQHGIDIDQDEYFVEDSLQAFTILTILVTDTTIEGNARDGVSIKSTYQVTLDDVTVRNNGDDGIHVRIAAEVLLQNVLSEENDQNGFLSFARGAAVTVTDSVFRFNGKDDGRRWQRAGVYVEFAHQAIFSNVISTENDQDGFYIFDVLVSKMTDVDSVANGNDGFQIQRSEDESSPAIIHKVEFLRVRACSNGNDGIDLVPRNGRRLQFSPLSQVVTCGNTDADLVIREGDEGVIFSLPSGKDSSKAVGITADSCTQYPDEVDCRRNDTFLSCNADACLPRDPVIL
jgi:Right handed beta helix region